MSDSPHSRPLPQPANISLFVFHIDVVLLGIFAVYVAFTLPRALVRLFQHSEILNGFYLHAGSGSGGSGATKMELIRSSNTPTSPTVRALVDITGNGVEGEGGKSSEPQHLTLITTPHAATTESKDSLSPRSLPSPRRIPSHVSHWRTIFRPTLAYALNYRVAPGFSVGNLLVFLAYTAVILYAFLRYPNPLANAWRFGPLAISQVPIAVALAGKTNWLSLASGAGYEKLNYIHRFVGYGIIIIANFHGLGYFYMWSLSGTIRSSLSRPGNPWGLVALCSFNLLFLSSHSFVRKRMYTLFITIHVTCVIVVLVATHKHRPICVPYVLTAVGLYAFDHLVRIVRTRYTTGWLTAEHALNGGTTLMRVPSLQGGWRAGQHVRVRVVRGGWFAWLATWFLGRARPFTIAVGPNSGGMMLEIKAAYSWTRNLLRMAGDAEDVSLEEMSTSVERGRGYARGVRVMIEGPYGGPGYTLLTAYSGAVLVAGGSGISYVMSVLDDMLRKHASGMSNVRVIEVIWSVTDPDSLYSLLPELTPLMHPRASQHTPLLLRFNVHWTRASSRPPRVPRTELPPGMYLHAGRPDIFDALQNVIAGVRTAYSTTGTGTQNDSSDLPSGIVIASCGPAAIMDDAARAISRVSWADWKDVGGVESVEEVFGW